MHNDTVMNLSKFQVLYTVGVSIMYGCIYAQVLRDIYMSLYNYQI